MASHYSHYRVDFCSALEALLLNLIPNFSHRCLILRVRSNQQFRYVLSSKICLSRSAPFSSHLNSVMFHLPPHKTRHERFKTRAWKFPISGLKLCITQTELEAWIKYMKRDHKLAKIKNTYKTKCNLDLYILQSLQKFVSNTQKNFYNHCKVWIAQWWIRWVNVFECLCLYARLSCKTYIPIYFLNFSLISSKQILSEPLPT